MPNLLQNRRRADVPRRPAVAEAMEKVSNSGAITIEEGKTTETTIEVVKGMKFDRDTSALTFAQIWKR